MNFRRRLDRNLRGCKDIRATAGDSPDPARRLLMSGRVVVSNRPSQQSRQEILPLDEPPSDQRSSEFDQPFIPRSHSNGKL